MRVRLENLTKRFGSGGDAVVAVREVDVSVEAGELLVLLGPSGCGKSTLLNLCAGLERPTAGEIRFDDRVVAAPQRNVFVPPKGRDVAMVFQSYALYPHLTVHDNIAFPLRIARRKKPTIEQAVQETAAMLGIGHLLDRRPAALSGGQRQRVAIARAVVRRPSVFLLDEPLSNLDAKLRTSTRTELKRLQRELGITTIYVTHDQVEAMTIGDRVALLRDGEIVQIGTPQELYDRPATPFAASFIGSPPMNLLSAEAREATEHEVVVQIAATRIRVPRSRVRGVIASGAAVRLGIRPEHVVLTAADQGAGGSASDAVLRGRVVAIESLGREYLYHVEAGGEELLALAPAPDRNEGETVLVAVDPRAAHVFGA
jgi:multiple sugar transport system ATP-binding protein